MDKARLVRASNCAGLFIVLIAGIGFYLKSVELLLAALSLEGLHSAFCGPVKYSILPQALRPQELIGGNALVEMGTFVAILVGTIVAGLLVTLELGRLWVSGLLALVAAVALAASFAIPRMSASDPKLAFNWNPVSETWRNVGVARADRAVYLPLLGISWFWFYGPLFLAQFPVCVN